MEAGTSLQLDVLGKDQSEDVHTYAPPPQGPRTRSGTRMPTHPHTHVVAESGCFMKTSWTAHLHPPCSSPADTVQGGHVHI